MENMPYGGVKDSGIGREGPAYAIRELTEEKLIVLNLEGCSGMRRGKAVWKTKSGGSEWIPPHKADDGGDEED